MNERAAWILVSAVGLGWFISEIILPAAVAGYTPPPGVNEGLGIVAGVLIAGLAARRRNGDGRGS